MIHIIYNAIYLTVIVFLFIWLCRAYDFANRKHKEMLNLKEQTKDDRNLLNHYNIAYPEFYMVLKNNSVKHSVVRMYKKIFRYEK